MLQVFLDQRVTQVNTFSIQDMNFNNLNNSFTWGAQLAKIGSGAATYVF